MERHELLEAMDELKLHGMRAIAAICASATPASFASPDTAMFTIDCARFAH